MSSCPCGANTPAGCGYPELAQEDRPAACLSLGLRFVPFDVFVAEEDETAEPLVGTAEETALPAGGDLIVYGTGGVGKTTWSVDGVAHVAAGVPWLGLDVPRPLVVTIVENEGPRGKFRQKLARKAATWEGPSFAERIHVLRSPWAGFTFSDPEHRAQLAAHVTATETDLLVAGPISTLGMIGGGTPDEINAFSALVAETRALLDRPLAVWLVHHENRAGQVSGAWERVPDTLVHLTATGNGHTRLYWQKCRWASGLHATTMHLTWLDGEGFAVDEEPTAPATEQRVWDDLATFVLANGGCSWNDAEPVTGKADQKRRVRDRMLAEGVLVNRGRIRPDGTPISFRLWHRDDPATPRDDDPDTQVRPLWDAPRDAPASHPEDGGFRVGASLRPSRKEDAGRDAPTPATSDALVECLTCERPFVAGEDGSAPLTCRACVARRAAT